MTAAMRTGISGIRAKPVGPNTAIFESEEPDMRSIGIEAAFIAAWATDATQIELVFS